MEILAPLRHLSEGQMMTKILMSNVPHGMNIYSKIYGRLVICFLQYPAICILPKYIYVDSGLPRKLDLNLNGTCLIK